MAGAAGRGPRRLRQAPPAAGSSITTTTRRLAPEKPGATRLLEPCPTATSDDRGTPLRLQVPGHG